MPGFSDLPILFFAPYDDYEADVLSDQDRFRSGERWLLYPQDAVWETTGKSQKLRELPRLPGEWDAHKLEAWQLVQGDMVLRTGDGDSYSFSITAEKARQKPYLTENGRFILPTTAKDFPLYAGRPPHLIVPTQQPHRWRITLRASGDSQPDGQRHYLLSELLHLKQEGHISLDLALPELLGDAPIGKFEIVVRGPLGQTHSLGLRIIPSLLIEGFDRIYLEQANSTAQFTFICDASTEIRQNPPQTGVNIQNVITTPEQNQYQVEAQSHIQQLTLQLKHLNGVVIPLTIPIYRLRWGLQHGQEEDQMVWHTQPTNIYPGSLLNLDAALWIDAPIVKEYPLHVGWQLVNKEGEILDYVQPEEKPIQQLWKIPLGNLTGVWRERQETLRLQLVINLPDQDAPLIIPAFYLLPTLDFGDLAYEWVTDGDEVILTLTWEQGWPGSHELQLWPLDRPWVQKPIVLRLPETAISLAEWRLPINQLPAEAYLGELLVHNPWQSVAPQRPKSDQSNILLIKPYELSQHYEVLNQLRDQQQADIEQLLALMAHQFYNNQQDEFFTTNVAIADQREILSLIWLIRWLDLTKTLNSTAYKIAQIRAFDYVVLERLSKETWTEEELSYYFEHLPSTFSGKLGEWVLQFGSHDMRNRSLEILCCLPSVTPAQAKTFEKAMVALMENVANGSLLLNEAVQWLIPNATKAAIYLTNEGSRDAQEILTGLAQKANLEPNWIAPGMLLETSLGKIQVDKLRWHITDQNRFCVSLKADCYVDGKLLLQSMEVAIRLDLHNHLLRFQNIEPYLCLYCKQLYGSVAEYQQHHKTVHAGENLSRKRLNQEKLNWIQPQLNQANEEKAL